MSNIKGGPCAVCTEHSTLQCTGCGINGPFYCTKEHQKKDWKQGEHRAICGAKAWEEFNDPTYGTVYKSKKTIANGGILFTRDPVLSFPRRFNQNDLSNSPFYPIMMNPMRLTPAPPPAPEDVVACLDCSGMMPYKQIMIEGVGGETRFHCCLRCEWPTHGIDCGKSHNEECKIFKDNNILWEDYKVVEDIYTYVGILRAVLLKKNSNPAFNTLMGMPSKSTLLYTGMIPQMSHVAHFLARCGLFQLITVPELTKLVEIIGSNYLLCNHRGADDTRYAVIVYNGTHGRILPHDCMANCHILIDKKTLVATVRAARQILPGEILTINYDPFVGDSGLRGAKSRLSFLRDIGVECTCARCTSCTENGTMYNAIRCQSQKCKNGEHYAVPTKQTPDDCPNVCMNPECKALMPHETIQSIHRRVMMITNQCQHDIGAMEKAYKNVIIKLIHPNHFLALRARLRISIIAGNLINKTTQYFKDVRQCILKPEAFVHHKRFLQHFKNQIEISRILQFGRADVQGGPHLLLSFYILLLIEKLGEDIQSNKNEPLTSFVPQLESIQSQWKDTWHMYKVDPMLCSESLARTKVLYDTHVKFLQSVVEPRISSWDSTPPVFKLFFGK